MRRTRLVWLGLGLALTACAPLPAQAPEVAVQPAAQPVAEPPAPPAQIESGPCLAFDAQSCTAGCAHGECLEWCGGQSCVQAIRANAACGEKARLESIAKVGDEPHYPICAGDCTDADIEKMVEHDAWTADQERAYEASWDRSCRQACVSGLEGEADGFCDWDPWRIKEWNAMAKPATPKSAERSILDSAAMMGSLVGTMGGSSLSLSRDQPAQLDRRGAVQSMISMQSSQLKLEVCVPDGRKTVEGGVVVHFDEEGKVSETVPDPAAPDSPCLAAGLQYLRLPKRVAASIGPLAIDVRAVALDDSLQTIMGGATMGEEPRTGGMGVSSAAEGL